MAKTDDSDRQVARARRSLPAVLAAAVIAAISLVAVGTSSASTDTGRDDTKTGVVVECRSGVVTEGDVSMSAMSVTRLDEAPTELGEGCHIVS